MMFSTFNLLVLKCSILYHILHGDGQSLPSIRHSTHRFINFVKHSFNYLNATKISNKLAVRSFDECGIQCVRTSTCLSVNMASSSDDNGVYWCEILASDKYMSSESFKPSPNSHHFSIMTPCIEDPCVGLQTCVPNYNDGSYKCRCLRVGFSGDYCQECDTTNGWRRFNISCYKFFSEVGKWKEAKRRCADIGSILVPIHSANENDFISSLLPDAETTAWIGANDMGTEGNWVWVDRKNWGEYENWSGNNPNGDVRENCALIQSGRWNDVSCGLRRYYVCKTKN